MDGEDGGLLDIEILDTDDEDHKANRTRQTEAEFQAVKQTYHVKVENGEIHQSVKLPLNSPPSKIRIQELLHAIEELYFFRRYRDALSFIEKMRHNGDLDVLDGDSRNQILAYERKCEHKLHPS